jgi:outer membrane lipoprotein-sorting protein
MCSNPVKIGMASLLTLIQTVVTFVALPPTAPAAEKKSETDARLETLLQEWEKANQDAREIHYNLQCTIEGLASNKQTSRAEAFVKKPSLFRIDWKDEKEKIWMTWIRNNGFFYEYDLDERQIHILRISSDLSEDSLDRDWLLNGICHQMHRGLQWFYIGFPVNEMRQHYLFRLNKEDKYWAYIRIDPRGHKEGEFKELEVVLSQKTKLVRQIRCVDGYGLKMIWDFERVETNPTPAITLESISKNLPKDWKKIYPPLKKSEAIEIAKAFVSEKKILYPKYKITAGWNDHDEWEVLFVALPEDSKRKQLVVVSEDGTQARLGSKP